MCPGIVVALSWVGTGDLIDNSVAPPGVRLADARLVPREGLFVVLVVVSHVLTSPFLLLIVIGLLVMMNRREIMGAHVNTWNGNDGPVLKGAHASRWTRGRRAAADRGRRAGVLRAR